MNTRMIQLENKSLVQVSTVNCCVTTKQQLEDADFSASQNKQKNLSVGSVFNRPELCRSNETQVQDKSTLYHVQRKIRFVTDLLKLQKYYNTNLRQQSACITCPHALTKVPCGISQDINRGSKTVAVCLTRRRLAKTVDLEIQMHSSAHSYKLKFEYKIKRQHRNSVLNHQF